MFRPDSRSPLVAAACRTIGWFCGLLVLWLAAGCGHAVSPAHTATTNTAGLPSTQGATPPAVLPGQRVGVVRVIGTGRRFVLVQVPSIAQGAALSDGQTLTCHGAAPATLRVSRERRPPFVVADVVAGEPHVGDEVFTGAAPEPPATASATPAASPAVPTASPALPDFRANPVPPPAF